MKVWIVGQYKGTFEGHTAWEFSGVFNSEADAVAACRDTSYFVGPAEIGEATPDERESWPGCYYPKTEEKAGV